MSLKYKTAGAILSCAILSAPMVSVPLIGGQNQVLKQSSQRELTQLETIITASFGAEQAALAGGGTREISARAAPFADERRANRFTASTRLAMAVRDQALGPKKAN